MAAKAKEFANVWAALSQKILASILVDDGAIFPVHDIIGAHSGWLAPKERPVYEAVLQCLNDDTPPTVEAVTVRLNGDTPKALPRTLAGQFSDEDNRHLVYNAEQLRHVGVLAEVRQFGRELSAIQEIGDITQTADEVTTKLGGILAGASNRKPDSESVNEATWEEVERAQESGIPTGLEWFDTLTGGLWRGMNYWIAAAYKSGKTTLMRNAVLKSGAYNHPVGVFCAEGSREMFALDCQAMLATEILIREGMPRDKLRLDGLFIRRYYWRKGVMTKHEIDAINEARDIWKGLPIYVWDTRDGIRNLATLRYLVKRGRVHHGIKSFWGDYSQLFGNGNTLYERQSATSLAIQDIAASENVAFCMLSQLSEEGVKSPGGGGRSPHVKGGGDAPAAADFLLVPTIDPDQPGIMDIALKLSRHTRTATGSHVLAPASGLIVDGIKTNRAAIA